jgi:hypothetical protein
MSDMKWAPLFPNEANLDILARQLYPQKTEHGPHQATRAQVSSWAATVSDSIFLLEDGNSHSSDEALRRLEDILNEMDDLLRSVG